MQLKFHLPIDDKWRNKPNKQSSLLNAISQIKYSGQQEVIQINHITPILIYEFH